MRALPSLLGALAAPRLLLLVAWSVLLFPAALATRALAGLGARRPALRLAARLQRLWARGCLPLFALRLEREGPPPSPGSIVVANHVSYLDVFVLAAALPGARFVAKSEIAGWPLAGWLARSAGTLFVEQGRRRDLLRVRERMRETLEAGICVVLFPEGRATSGATVERFHPSLLDPATRPGVRCVPAALSYATPDVPWGVAWTACWWGGMDLPRHLWRLLRSGRVRARLALAPALAASGAGRGSAGERKVLARRARAALLERFRPMTQEPPPPDDPWPELTRGKPLSDPRRSPDAAG